MIASVGHQRVFIRSLIYKPPSAFQRMEQLPQVLKTSFSLCPLQKLLPKPCTLKFTIYIVEECCSSVEGINTQTLSFIKCILYDNIQEQYDNHQLPVSKQLYMVKQNKT